MKKVLFVIVVVLSLAICMPAIAENNGKTIGISLFYRRDEYYKDLEVGFKLAAEKAGYTTLIQDADTDPARQTQQIEDFVTKGVDAIALSATDPAGVVPAIEDAVTKGVPVFTFDGPSMSDKVVTHVGFDFYEDGVNIGEWTRKYILDNLGGKAKVAVIDFPQSAITCAQRADGFIAAVTKDMPGVEIVARQDGKASRTDSMAVMENILAANPDVDVVFGVNYDTAAGAMAAIEAANAKAIVVCCAWGAEPFEQLEANHPIFKAASVTSPIDQAFGTIQAISDYFAGKPVPKAITMHSMLLDATTIKNFDWKSIIALRGE